MRKTIARPHAQPLFALNTRLNRRWNWTTSQLITHMMGLNTVSYQLLTIRLLA